MEKIFVNNNAGYKTNDYQIFFFPHANPGSFTFNGNWADIVANRIFFLSPGTVFSINCEGAGVDCFHIGFESSDYYSNSLCYFSIIPQDIKNKFLDMNIKLTFACMKDNEEQMMSITKKILLCLDKLVSENHIIFAARHVGRIVRDIPRHYHNSEYQVEYFNEGIGSIKIENRWSKYSNGTLCFIPPLVSHEIKYPKSNDIDNYTIKFKISDDSKYSIIHEAFVAEIPDERKPIVLGLLKKIVGEFVQDIPISSENLINFIEIINTIKVSLSKNGAKENKLISQVKHIINMNLSKNLCIKDISSQLGLSHEHISRQFRKLTGETITSYINLQRLEASLEMLKNTNMPLKQIASECGFKSVNYFHTIFKKKFSFTPNFVRND
jgi:AraC-like DNA-binding protein